MMEGVPKEEVRGTLFAVKQGKSPRPNRLTVKFYVGFFNLIKEVILKIVSESQSSRRMLSFLNSIHLVIIPRKQDTKCFEDFRPISCCNVIYKPMANIIAVRFNHIFNIFIQKNNLIFPVIRFMTW